MEGLFQRDSVVLEQLNVVFLVMIEGQSRQDGIMRKKSILYKMRNTNLNEGSGFT